jgi:glycosyltransferase involved in cell wall biosynthesis
MEFAEETNVILTLSTARGKDLRFLWACATLRNILAKSRCFKMNSSMRVVQVVHGTFHHFDLARELETRGHLQRVYSGFPWRRLAREGVSRDRVSTFPWIHTSLFLLRRYWRMPPRLSAYLDYQNSVQLDNWVASRIASQAEVCDVVVGLSNAALKTGRLVQSRGGKYVCDRGSSHVRYQAEILDEEHRRWGVPPLLLDERAMRRQEAEYAAADAITIPSEFARRSFVEMGVPAGKIHRVPYGVQLTRFQPGRSPSPDTFDVLFAGTVCLRKGVPYLLQAFRMLKHPRKRLRLAGSVAPDALAVLQRLGLGDIEVLGSLPQQKLAECMSGSHVLVLPSIEDGFGLVLSQAMACGCPVISSVNTGGEDLFQDGVQGFLVPIRSPEAIHERLVQLADDPDLRQRMSSAALARVQSLGGWTTYGDDYTAFLQKLVGEAAIAPATG